MARETYAEYCCARALEERALGQAAGKGRAGDAHDKHAARYEHLAAQFRDTAPPGEANGARVKRSSGS